MQVHLIDGTYELFRHFFPIPSHINAGGEEVAATRAVIGSCLSLLEDGATHIGIATDHVIESWRNELWAGYKTGEGMEPEILSQFPLLEGGLTAAGFAVWPMVEQEADDGLGAAAAMAALDERVERVLICTADKDLAQCVVDPVIAQFDRRKGTILDEAAVIEKYGVPPTSIPDYLALVGDTADGFPGVKGWGAKSTATVLSRYGSVEAIPAAPGQWDVAVRGAAKLSAALEAARDDVAIFKRLATLDLDAPVSASVDELEWVEPTSEFAAWCDRLDAPGLLTRAERLATERR